MLGGGEHDFSGSAGGADALSEASLSLFRWEHRMAVAAATAMRLPGAKKQTNHFCAGILPKRSFLGASAVDAAPPFLPPVVGLVALSTYDEMIPMRTRNGRRYVRKYRQRYADTERVAPSLLLLLGIAPTTRSGQFRTVVVVHRPCMGDCGVQSLGWYHRDWWGCLWHLYTSGVGH